MSSPPDSSAQAGEDLTPAPNRSPPTGRRDDPEALPPPGNPAAVDRGCRCPTLANRPEAGESLAALIAPDCAMHHL